jgi:hypothetical protein
VRGDETGHQPDPRFTRAHESGQADPGPRDARAKVVKLTKKGERSLEIAVLAWGEVENEWAKLLGGPAAMQEVREAMFAFIEKYGDWHRGEQPRLRPVW